MRFFLYIVFFTYGYNSFGQVTIEQPQYYYVSEWLLEEVQELPVGTKILFQQNCTTRLPANVPTGIIFFENVNYKQEKFSMAVEFKDTIVASVTYYLKARQKDLLKILGYVAIKAKGSAVKRQWTYYLNEMDRHTVITGDKKRIVVIQISTKSLPNDGS